MSLAKPVLRNLLQNKTKIDFGVAMVVGFALAMAYKYGVQHPRRDIFYGFYKTYDADKDYERMKSAGVFQYVKP